MSISFHLPYRAVNILPNQFVGVVGEHKDFPVENLSISHCKKLLASCSHDQTVKFWNIEDIEKEEIETRKRKKTMGKNNKPKMLNKAAKKDDFFADFAEQEETEAAEDKKDDSDNSDDSDEETEKETQVSSNSATTEGVNNTGSGQTNDEDNESDDSSFDEDEIDSDEEEGDDDVGEIDELDSSESDDSD